MAGATARRRSIAEYDGPAFDARAETLPLEHFEPVLRRVLSRPRNSIYRAALEGR